MTRPIFNLLKLHGIMFDLDPEDCPPDRWTSGKNVFFKNGEIWRCEGINKVYDPGRLFPADVVWYVDMGMQEWWLYASGSGIGVTDGAGNHYDLTPAGWGPIVQKNFIFSIGDLNTLPWINHPEKGPYWWDGNIAHKMVKLPDWPATWSCRTMRAHKNFLFAIGITDGAVLMESQVSWSSSADPGQVPQFWNPSPTNDAGDFTFATPGGPLISGISLRDQFFIMQVDATYSGQYVGGQWIFQSRDVFPSTGIFAPNAAIEHDNLIYMLTGRGEFVRHDGQSVQNLLYGVAQDYLVQNINHEWPASVFLYFTDQNGVLAVAYPTAPNKACTEALGIEIASIGREGPVDVGIRELPSVTHAAGGFTEITGQSWNADPDSWDSDQTTWQEQPSGYRPLKLVFAGGTNGLLELGKGVDVLGQAIDAYLERIGMDLGEFGTHKVISGGFPRLRGPNGDVIYYRMGRQEQVRSAVQWGVDMAFTIGKSQQLDFFQEGRLMAYSIRSHGGGIWNANGIQLMARAAGRW